MKMRDARVRPTSDGKYVVSCEMQKDNGQWCEMQPKEYVAESLSEVGAIIDKAMSEAGKMKDEKKGKKDKDRSVERLMSAKPSDEDEDY
jgi:hypothetical protein